eukprot:scaffold23595_cov196-Cylindrotheca_fusiformis.AAC.1
MSEEDSIWIDDSPFGTWANDDELGMFSNAAVTTNNELEHSSFSLHSESNSHADETHESLSVAMGNRSNKNIGHQSFLHFEPEQQHPSDSSDASLDFRDALFSMSPKRTNPTDEDSPNFLQFGAEQSIKVDDLMYGSAESFDLQNAFSSASIDASNGEFNSFDYMNKIQDQLNGSEGSFALDDVDSSRIIHRQEEPQTYFEPNHCGDLLGDLCSRQDCRKSAEKVSYQQQCEEYRRKTIAFAHSKSASLEEEDLFDNSVRAIDIFALERNHGSPSNGRDIPATDEIVDDDSAFTSEEDESDDLDKEIKRQLMYYFAGMGLFYVLGKLISFLCKLCRKGNRTDTGDAAKGVNPVTSAARDSMGSASGMQAGFATTIGGGATTTTVSSAVVAGMAIRAAAITASSAASASGGMATVLAAGRVVAPATGVSGLTVGTMATVVTVAVSAAVVGSGVVTLQEQVRCAGSDIVQESLGRMRINFRNPDLPPKNDLEDLFVSVYNSVSQGCSEPFQRNVVSASLESYADSGFGVDTLWTATVSCSPECPVEPLFGGTLEEAYSRRKLADGKEIVSLIAFGEYLDDSYRNSPFFVDQQCEPDTADCARQNARNDAYVVFVQVLNSSYVDSAPGGIEVLDEYYVNGDNVPSASPSGEPTISDTPTLTATPTLQPTTAFPTFSPTVSPTTIAPSQHPSVVPSEGPTGAPTVSSAPSPEAATSPPTGVPSKSPTIAPTLLPSESPSSRPSPPPSAFPTDVPTASPSAIPSLWPSNTPPVAASSSPSIEASSNPSTASS